MALGNVFISDVDGNIPSNLSSGNEKLQGSCLMFHSSHPCLQQAMERITRQN